MTEQVKLNLISGIVQIVATAGTVAIAYFARKFGSQLRDIHKNTNSLVVALVTEAKKEGDRAGYDRAQQENQNKKRKRKP